MSEDVTTSTDWVLIEEAAVIAGRSEESLRRWKRLGKIASKLSGNGRLLFSKNEIRAFMSIQSAENSERQKNPPQQTNIKTPQKTFTGPSVDAHHHTFIVYDQLISTLKERLEKGDALVSDMRASEKLLRAELKEARDVNLALSRELHGEPVALLKERFEQAHEEEEMTVKPEKEETIPSPAPEPEEPERKRRKESPLHARRKIGSVYSHFGKWLSGEN
jgi:hypothetical protein